jgi:molecular chaperone GrpE (heat shock protein)
MSMELGLFTAASPASLRILRTNPDGSGVVEMPILRAGTINRALTAGKGEGALTISTEDLRDMAANFAAWPGPVPINVQPHRTWSETSGKAPGFIEAMEARGNDLFAQLFLVSDLFREVAAGSWRGFSVDIARGIELPTASFSTWAVWGGVFTNRPAADVHFRNADYQIAAEAIATVAQDVGDQEYQMADEKSAALEAQLNAKDTAIDALQTEMKTLRNAAESAKQVAEKAGLESSKVNAENVALAAQLKAERASKVELQATIESLTSDLERVRGELTSEKNANLAASIRKVINTSLNRGVDAAVFEGSEKDPVKWMKSTFASFEAFESHVLALRGRKGVSVTSGSPDDETVALSSQHAEVIRSLGLDPKYATIQRESDLANIKKG